MLPYLDEVDKELVGPGAEPFADGIHNATVGLMRDDELDAGNIGSRTGAKPPWQRYAWPGRRL